MFLRAEPLRKSSSATPAPARTAAAVPRFVESPVVQRLRAISRALNARPDAVAQRAMGEQLSAAPVAERAPVNRTGLPDALKSGVEALSGISMDDVRVHRNSGKPAQLQAHAYAQGTEIHVAPGQERHLPHEAWHVVQQKQGRVQPTMQLEAGVPVNDEAGLEREADAMGARASGGDAEVAQALETPAVQRAVVQCIRVGVNDIGQRFVVTTNAGWRTVGVLREIRGGGWYRFSVGLVRGMRNIHHRVNVGTAMEEEVSNYSHAVEAESDDFYPFEEESDDFHPFEEESDDFYPIEAESDDFHAFEAESDYSHAMEEENDSPGHESRSNQEMDTGMQSVSDVYTSGYLPTDQNEFNVEAEARAQGISASRALVMIRNSFQENPRTLRIHYPFGAKTVSRGTPAFNTPDETSKTPQGMVNYQGKDFGPHKKVAKDYDEWAAELSDSEMDEEDKRALASDILAFLQTDPTTNFAYLTARQKAALGGLLTVGLISDPMRTEFNSGRTARDFTTQIDARARGETTFFRSFGDKINSEFLPARTGGSKQQRDALREETAKTKEEEEVEAHDRLWQNNCLINAISQAARGSNANLAELVTIRGNLNNLGQMMVATPQTVNVIRTALGINNTVLVRYPIGVAPDETILGTGTGPLLIIYHNGGDHFQHTPPLGVPYAGMKKS